MSICCRLVRALAVVLLAVCATSQELNSTLHSTISGVPVAFANENVIFTCIARGSNHMGWSSDEYIGTGGRRLDFISTNAPGTMRISGETRAELISASVDEFIISRLYIRILPTLPIVTVKCENIGAGTMTSITFPLADDTSLMCDRQSVCPGDTLTCVCVTGQSNTLIWTVNGNEQQFASNDSLNTMRSVSGSSAFATLTENSARNGVRIIMSNLTVNTSVSLFDPEIILTCQNVDRAVTEPAIIPIAENCPMIQITTSDESQSAPAMGSSDDVIVAAVVPVVIAIGVIVIAIIVAIALYQAKYKPLKAECNQKDGEKQTELIDLENKKDEEKKSALKFLTKQKEEEKVAALQNLTEQKNQEIDRLRIQKDMEKTRALDDLTRKKEQEKTAALKALTKQKDQEKEIALKDLATQMGSGDTTSSITADSTSSSRSLHGHTPTSSSQTASVSHSGSSSYHRGNGQSGRTQSTGMQDRYHYNSQHN